MKKSRFSAFLLIAAMAVILLSPAVSALEDPQIDCQSAVLLSVDGTNETVLYTRNEHDRVSPASLTKVMTVLLAVEAVESGAVTLSDPVTAQAGFDFDLVGDGTSVYLTVGETMTLEHLLYCAIVASANDACNVIGQYIGGTVSDFVARMNQRAAELGCTETHFSNTHGLTAEDHYTTAWDFSRILREAVSHELFMTICNTVDYTVPATNSANERSLSSTNSLINDHNPMYPGDYLYEYAEGIKTGHTSDAGYCLASSAQKDSVRLLSVVFRGDAYEIEGGSWYYAHFADTITLFDWAFNNFTYQEIVKSTEMVGEVAVTMGADADAVSVRPSTSIVALLPTDEDLAAFERSINITVEGGTLEAPVSAGQPVGEITVSKNGVVYGTASLVTATSIELSRVQYMKSQIGDTLKQPGVVITFWALVLLFGAYIVLVVRYRSKRRAYKKRLADSRQVRLDMVEDEEDVRYVPRPHRGGSTPMQKKTVVLEPETLKETEAPPAEAPEDVSDEDVRIAPAPGKGYVAHDTDPTRTDPIFTGEDKDDPLNGFFDKK